MCSVQQNTLHQFHFHLVHVAHKFDGYFSWAPPLCRSPAPLVSTPNALTLLANVASNECWILEHATLVKANQTQPKLCTARMTRYCAQSRAHVSHPANWIDCCFESSYNPNVIVYHTLESKSKSESRIIWSETLFTRPFPKFISPVANTTRKNGEQNKTKQLATLKFKRDLFRWSSSWKCPFVFVSFRLNGFLSNKLIWYRVAISRIKSDMRKIPPN